jgi:hypothetical protein
MRYYVLIWPTRQELSKVNRDKGGDGNVTGIVV